MEDILEFIFELFAEIIEALATSKRVPLLIRIIAMLLISAFLLALTGASIYGIITLKGIFIKVLLGFVVAVGLILFILFQKKWWKSI